MSRTKKTSRLPTSTLVSAGELATKKAMSAVTPSPTAIHQYTRRRNALTRSAAWVPPTRSHGLSDSSMDVSSTPSVPRPATGRSGLEHHLDGSVFLAIEDGVSPRRLLEGQGVGDDG